MFAYEYVGLLINFVLQVKFLMNYMRHLFIKINLKPNKKENWGWFCVIFFIISTYFGAPKGRSIKFMQEHLPDDYNHAIQHSLLVSATEKIVGLGNCFRQIFRFSEKKKLYFG